MLDLTEFEETQARLLARVPRKFERSLARRIDWSDRMLGVFGGRGTGKSTLLLQHLAAAEEGEGPSLYLSADHIRVEALGLYEIGASFFRHGGRTLVVDEVHKASRWAQQLKNLYDAFPDVQLVFSGSSTLQLQLGKTDLSRRAVFHPLPPMSFREFLALRAGRAYPAVGLEELLGCHAELATEVLADGPVLGLFRDYLSFGAYPFFLEGEESFHGRLRNVIEKVLYEDIPPATGMRTSGVPVMKKLLWQVASAAPFSPNIDRMASGLGVARTTVYSYIEHLERAGLLCSVLPAGTGSTLARRRGKLLLANTNLLRAVGQVLHPEDPLGTVRETFFVSQLAGAGLVLRVAARGDFLVEGGPVFEIGGRSKSWRQLRGERDAYLVKDDLESGGDRVIPLWLLGMLY